jgi:hypothetical protein
MNVILKGLEAKTPARVPARGFLRGEYLTR